MSFLRRATLGRKLFFGVVVLSTALALFYAVVDWRAARAWAECRRTLRAQGEALNFSDLEGAPVPPARNLALLPFFTHWGAYRVDPKTGRAVFLNVAPTPYFSKLPRLTSEMIDSFPGVENFDLAAWQRYFQHGSADAAKGDPAQSVLQALEPFRPILDALSAARDAMPTGEFRREYKGPMGHDSLQSHAGLKLNLTLLLRASAETATGQAPQALHDIETALWLRHATCGEPPKQFPFILGVALLSEMKAPIESGLATGGWNAEELARLQGELARIDLGAEYTHAIRGERAWYLEWLDQSWPNLVPAGTHWPDRLFYFAAVYGPRGWLDQSKTAFATWHQELLTTCDPTTHRIDPAKHRALLQRDQGHSSSLDFGSFILLHAPPAREKDFEFAAKEQAQLDEIIIRCALARYTLTHAGSYPAALGELTPEYLDHLPLGVADGTTLRYQVTADGRYHLGPGSVERK